MVPLSGSAIKFSIVSPFNRFPPKGRVYQYSSRKAYKKGDYLDLQVRCMAGDGNVTFCGSFES